MIKDKNPMGEKISPLRGGIADGSYAPELPASLPCEHEWTEGVDDDGQLIEPAYDVCRRCGLTV